MNIADKRAIRIAQLQEELAQAKKIIMDNNDQKSQPAGEVSPAFGCSSKSSTINEFLYRADTEIIDKLFLELSQFTRAKTAREIELAHDYNELIYAVGTKFPGESRHETALRYIRQAESRVSQVGCDGGQAEANVRNHEQTPQGENHE